MNPKFDMKKQVAPLGIFLLVATTLFACSGSEPSGNECLPQTCEGECVAGVCDSTDTVDDADADIVELQDVIDVEDLADTDDTGETTDVVDSDGTGPDSEDGDSTDTPVSGRLFERCRAVGDDEFCSQGQESCMAEFTFSDTVSSIDLHTIAPNLPRFDDQGAPLGICTSLCNGGVGEGAAGFCHPDLDAKGYTCVLVAVGESTYPDGAARGGSGFPVPVDSSERTNGTPYLSICVPPSQPEQPSFCTRCDDSDDCSGGICRTDGELDGICTPRCDDNGACPAMFKCELAEDGETYCVPPLNTCSACIDLDGDGYGIGACEGEAGGREGIDCDDMDADIHFRPDANATVDAICELEIDRNCNGIEDSVEYSGVDAPDSQQNCLGCKMECPSFVEGDVNNASAGCVLVDGASDCGLQCRPGFADCDGDIENGCEADLSRPDTCGSCEIACEDLGRDGVNNSSCVPNSTEGFGLELGSCQDDDGADREYRCKVDDSQPFACGEDKADCNGCFADGCEVDISSSDAHCDACGYDCSVEGIAGLSGDSHLAFMVCESGTCVRPGGAGQVTRGCVANLTNLYADCDGDLVNGCEVDLRSDELHCGGCDAQPCGQGEQCILGECVLPSCNVRDFLDCDGLSTNQCETDTRTVELCGGCDPLPAEDWQAARDSNCTAYVPDLDSSSVGCGGFKSIAASTHRQLQIRCDSTADGLERQYRCADSGSVEDGSDQWLSIGEFDAYMFSGGKRDQASIDCGRCGNQCAQNFDCENGECVFSGTCPLGFENCNGEAEDGCETDIGTVFTCGDCPERGPDGDLIRQCPTVGTGSSECVRTGDSYSCDFECAAGRADCVSDAECSFGQNCSGCETTLGTVDHCGGCDVECALEQGRLHADNEPLCSDGGCFCAPVPNNAGDRIDRESCDGVIDSCYKDLDEGCPATLGTRALIRQDSRIVAPTSVRDLPRGEFQGRWAGATASGSEGPQNRWLTKLEILTPRNNEVPRIGAINASFASFPPTLTPSGPVSSSGGNFSTYAIKLPTAGDERVQPDEILLNGGALANPLSCDGAGDSINASAWSVLEGSQGYADVSGGWTSFIVGFIIERGPMYPDGGCGVGFSNTCGLGFSASDGDCAGGSGDEWGGQGDSDCGLGLFCKSRGSNKDDPCELIVKRDPGGVQLTQTLENGIAVHNPCQTGGESSVGLLWSGERSECDESPSLSGTTRTSLMYDGITGIRLLCASMRVVESSPNELTPTDRYRVEVAGSPLNPTEPRVATGGYGSIASEDFGNLNFARPRDGIDLLVRRDAGRVRMAPLSGIGFHFDDRPYPHQSFATGNQQQSEERAEDHIFWNMSGYWWNFRENPRPNP